MVKEINYQSKRKHMEVILYLEDGFTSENIKSCLRDSVDKYCIVLHDHDIGKDGKAIKKHYHVYLHFGNDTSWSIASVVKWFDVDKHLGYPIKSDENDKNNKHGMYRTIRYYTHFDHPEKYQYDPAAFTANFDVVAFLEQEEQREPQPKTKGNLDEILNRCASGEITRTNYHQHMTGAFFAKNRTLIRNAWQYYDDIYRADTQGNRDLKVTYIYGPSGAGKTTLALLMAQQMGLSAFLATNSKNILDSYNDEEVLILDDIRSNKMRFTDLLGLIDPHYLSDSNARYNNVLVKAKFIYLTSVQDIYSFYNSYDAPEEPATQLYRRIEEMWSMSQNRVALFKYDNTKGYTQYQVVDNPVPVYLAHRHASEKESVQSVDLLRGIIDSYTDKQLSLYDTNPPAPSPRKTEMQDTEG